jgi:hypothetical protein
MRFNTTTTKIEIFSNGVWLDLDTPPLISSVGYAGSTTAADPAGGETITVLGSNFSTPTVIKFRDTSTGVTTVFTGAVTLVNSTQLSITSQALPAADYDLLVESNGVTGVFSGGYTTNALPGWSTAAGNIGSVGGGAVVSITVAASETDGGPIAYSVTSGSLPTGLSLTTNVIGGTAGTVVADTTSTFTMRAIDDEGQIADRTFNIVVTSEYLIGNSLRFNDDDSAYLSWTPGSAGNRKTWTYSFWYKRCKFGSRARIIGTTDPWEDLIRFENNDKLLILSGESSGYTSLTTTQVFRDPSAWYHIVFAVDTTQATASNRAKLYVNGSQVTAFDTETYASQNLDSEFNDSTVHYMGSSAQYIDGYMADVNFVDGQALNPTAFGKVHDVYGHWVPTAYSGTYGTNGYFLNFGGNIAYDQSGNGNNWIANNIDLTNDFSMLDTPTNNFSTINPLDVQDTGTISEGNLKSDSNNTTHSTMGMSTGKWYWETFISGHDSGTHHIGIHIMDHGDLFNSHWDTGHALFWPHHGGIQYDGTSYSGTIVTYSTNDIISVALDLDNRTISMYKNNTVHPFINNLAINNEITDWLNTGNSVAAVTRTNPGCRTITNFGQDSSFAGAKTSQNNADGNGYGDFYYAPPTGFNSLCTRNLPDPTVVPGEHFNVVTYAGDGAANHAITGVGFQPDFTWLKHRNNPTAHQHNLFDIVRGATKTLHSNSTEAEETATNMLSSFDSDGFTINTDNAVNQSPYNYVAWNWKANGAGVSNTDGTISSTVSANVAAGFSIIKYVGNEVNGATVGHGLTKTPGIVIVKNTSQANAWCVQHKYNTDVYFQFQDIDAAATGAGVFNNTAPTSAVFSIADNTVTNSFGRDYIAYCWTSIEGYSKVGSYTGNGSLDGAFIYTGFRPAFVMTKRTDATDGWAILDSTREPNNEMTIALKADQTSADDPDNSWRKDFLSNGFKHRTINGWSNAAGGTYIYIAFAETPFKHSNAR